MVSPRDWSRCAATSVGERHGAAEACRTSALSRRTHVVDNPLGVGGGNGDEGPPLVAGRAGQSAHQGRAPPRKPRHGTPSLCDDGSSEGRGHPVRPGCARETATCRRAPVACGGAGRHSTLPFCAPPPVRPRAIGSPCTTAASGHRRTPRGPWCGAGARAQRQTLMSAQNRVDQGQSERRLRIGFGRELAAPWPMVTRTLLPDLGPRATRGVDLQ